MTTTRRNSSLVLAMVTLVVLAAVAGCGGDAPPQDPNQMVLRTYDLPDDAAGREMRAGLVDPPDAPVTVPPDRRGDTAVRRVATGDDRVVYYLVGGR